MLSEKRRANILLVDDSKLNIEMLSSVLVDKYNLYYALSGKEALRKIKCNKPDLILLDIVMDGMDGHEVCRRIKADSEISDIPVIFVSSKDYAFDEAMGFELGAVDYITKPINPIIVNARVKTHLSSYYHQIELEKKVEIKTREIYETRLEIIRKLAVAAEYKDNDTGLHIARMSRYCYIIAKNYGLSEHEARILLNVAPMHDIGKIGIPDEILSKKGKLNDDEWEIMKKHSSIGKEILGNNANEILKAASIVAFEHHEKWDGSGYPSGIKFEEIHIYARIVALADVFDALTSKRPYKDAWDFGEAVKLIKRESGKHFEPKLVEVFEESLTDILKIKHRYSSSILR